MADKLEFNPEGHEYRFGGIRVPNVTGIIDSVCNAYGYVDKELLDYAKELGTAVHLATELYDNDDLDVQSVELSIVPYLEAWINFRNETGFEPITIEQRIFNKRYYYAGQLDRTGILFDDLCLVDIKSGAPMPYVGPQTAAYTEAHNYRNKEKIKKRYVVYLMNTGLYRLVSLDDKSDFSVFLSFLQIHNWRLKHGI